MEEVFIYLLKHPLTEEIKYVGKTTNPKRRWYHHCSKKVNSIKNNYRVNWLNCLLKNNLKPILEIIEKCEYFQWEEREKYWIDFYRNKGANLCNSTYGGSGILGLKRSLETKLKISKNNAKTNKIYKKVYQFDKEGNFIKEYENPTIASNETNIKITKILRCCNNLYRIGAGYMWSYDKDFNLKPLKNKEKCKPVLCFDKYDNFIEEFESLSQASRKFKISISSIANCCKNKKHCLTSGGYKWKYK